MNKHKLWFRGVLFFFLLLGQSVCLFAQLGNEWIDISKHYYKFSISNEGIFRIPYSVLSSTNLEMQGSSFQLWNNGQQVPIFVTTAQEFAQGDFIEFHAKPNDGFLDKDLYDDSSWQMQSSQSLYSNQAVYFLTDSDSEQNLRIGTGTNSLAGAPEPESYCWYESRIVFDEEYYRGEPRLLGSRYVPENLLDANEQDLAASEWTSSWDNRAAMQAGEGFSSEPVSSGEVLSRGLQADAAVLSPNTPNAILRMGLLGRSNDLSISPDHHLEVRWNEEVMDDLTLEGYEQLQYQLNIPAPQLQNVNLLEIESLGDLGELDEISAAYASLRYARDFDLEGVSFLRFTVYNPLIPDPHLTFTNFSSNLQFPLLYDLTTNERYFGNNINDLIHFRLSESEEVRELFLQKIENIQNITELEERNFTNFDFQANQGKYVILYPEELEATAISFGLYRTSNPGGGNTSVLINVASLYDQFAYGVDGHPLAIRNFLAFAEENFSDKPKHVLLLGTGVDLKQLTEDSELKDENLMPAIGSPACDFLYAFSNDQRLSTASIGRLPIVSNAEGQAYLDKVQQYEEQTRSCERGPYQYRERQALLGHARNPEESEWLSGLFSNLEALSESGPLSMGMQTWIENTEDDVPANFEEFHEWIVEGAGMLCYFGESDSNGAWWNLEENTNPASWGNQAAYPLVFSASDYTTASFQGQGNSVLGQKLLTAANRGAIAVIGSSGKSYYRSLEPVLHQFVSELQGSAFAEPVGETWNATISQYLTSENDYDRYTLENLQFLGDPAIRIQREALPDFTILEPGDVWFTPIVNQEGISSVDLFYRVSNIGYPADQEFAVQVIRSSETSTDLLFEGIKTYVEGEDNVYSLEIEVYEEILGLNQIEILINPEEESDELCFENNAKEVSLFLNDLGCSEEIVQIPNLQESYCLTGSGGLLEGSPAGGSFLIDGESSDTINPTELGVGLHEVSYTLESEDEGCPDSIFESSFLVTEGPAAIFQASSTQACLYEDLVFEYVGNASSSANYIWDFGSGAIGGDITGLGPHEVLWTTGGQKSVSLIVQEDECFGSYVINVQVALPLEDPGLICESTDLSSVTVSWLPQLAAESYLLQVNESEVVLDADINQYTVDNLELGDEITFALTAFGNEICGNRFSGPLTCVAEGCIDQALYIANLPDAVCLFDPPFEISANPAGGVFSGSGIMGSMYNPLQSGSGIDTVRYTWIDGDCSYTTETLVDVREDPVAEISQIGDLCVDESVMLEVTDGFSAYQWIGTGALGQSLEVAEPGQYNVIVADDAGCQGAAISFVSAPGIQGEIFSNTGEFFYCEGQASLFLDFNTAEQEVSMEWQDGTTGPLEVTSSGEYTAFLSQPNGCLDQMSVFVEVIPAPEPVLISDTGELSICNDEPLTVTCEQSFEKYEWFLNSSPLEYPESQNSIVITEPGDYLLVVTNEQGCVGSFLANIEGGGAIQTNILAPDASNLCAGTEVVLQLDNVFENYLWSTGEQTASIQVSTPGNYSVVVSTAGGCSGEASTFMDFQSTPVVDLGPNTDVQFGNEYLLNPVSQPGDFSYNWSTGDSSPTLTVTASGTYGVTVVDNNTNCSASDEITVSFLSSNVQAVPRLWAVYPTMTRDVLNVELLAVRQGQYKLTLKDLTGRELGEWSMSMAEHQLDVSAFQSGMYLLLLAIDQQNVAAQKIILQ